MHYIGLMSGTSADGIDAALVFIDDDGRVTLAANHLQPLPDDIKSEIHALSQPGNNEIERLGELDTRLGSLFAEAAIAVLRLGGLTAGEIRAIGSHGQTIRHHPEKARPFSLQIGNPAVITERTGITTVADFRRRDLAAGGQGAPLVPAFHAAQFRSPSRSRAILNLGGIANVTYLPVDPAAPVLGFDTGPGNTLLDGWIRARRGLEHDAGGAWAASGSAHEALLARWLDDPYFRAPPPKSTGREHFHLAWVEAALASLKDKPNDADVQATLLELTARSAAQAIAALLPPTDEVYLCGGGAHNATLVAALSRHLSGIDVRTTDVLGIAPEWIEACAFAWLAHRTIEGRPGNLPSVTGARHPVILGAVYPA
jgi:anhydro-N-acetylmuramic acid kinase